MGTSIILLKKEFLELTVEIDRNVKIEMSTGFGTDDRVTTHASMPITKNELVDVIKVLQDLHYDLEESWICEDCQTINRKEWTECNTCERRKDESLPKPLNGL